MRWRAHASSIVLSVLALGAVVYAYVDRGSVTEGEKKARTSNVFPAWRRDDLARIAIQHGAQRIVLERTKDDAGEPQWWLREPRVEKADQDAVEKLASSLEFANVARKVDPSIAVSMDSPRATGDVGMGAVTYHFSLGGAALTPVGAAYLRVEGAGTVVVSDEVATVLMQPADAYRSRAVVPYLSVELSRLDVKGSRGGFAIVRADDVSFKLGSGLRASRDKLDGVWSALAEARAEAFVDDATQVPSPVVLVTMTPRDGRPPGVLRFGDACPGHDADVVVVRDSPTKLAACAPKGSVAGLDVTEASLTDPRLFAAHDDEVAELRIESLAGGPALELARKDSAWRQKAPVERDLAGDEADAATVLVTAIVHADGADPKRSDAPFDAKTRVTVRRADASAAEVVEVGAVDATGGALVRRAFDGALLHVDASVARRLVPSAVALRGKDVWSPAIEGAAARTVETHCDGVDQRVARDGASWTMVSPAGYGADNASILDATESVERARAEAWIADRDDGHMGFGSCWIALDLDVDGGARTVRIDLGAEVEGGVYARASDGPAVFRAPKALRDRARTWLVDLHGFAPAHVTSVVLERDGKRLSFAADAGATEDAGDDGTDDVIRAAAILRADSVVHLGAARPEEGFAHPSMSITVRGDGAERTLRIGASPAGDDKKRYARLGGVDATFTIERGRIQAMLDRF